MHFCCRTVCHSCRTNVSLSSRSTLVLRSAEKKILHFEQKTQPTSAQWKAHQLTMWCTVGLWTPPPPKGNPKMISAQLYLLCMTLPRIQRIFRGAVHNQHGTFFGSTEGHNWYLYSQKCSHCVNVLVKTDHWLMFCGLPFIQAYHPFCEQYRFLQKIRKINSKILPPRPPHELLPRGKGTQMLCGEVITPHHPQLGKKSPQGKIDGSENTFFTILAFISVFGHVVNLWAVESRSLAWALWPSPQPERFQTLRGSTDGL